MVGLVILKVCPDLDEFIAGITFHSQEAFVEAGVTLPSHKYTLLMLDVHFA